MSIHFWHFTGYISNSIASDSSDSSESSEASTGNSNLVEYKKGFDPVSMNPSVKPGEDFYEYAQGSWIKNHPVPPDKSRYGEFAIVKDRNYERVKDIIESAANNPSAPAGSLEQKVGEFYRVGMDNSTLERQRLYPIILQTESY